MGRGQGGVGNLPEQRAEHGPHSPNKYGTAAGRSGLGRRREPEGCLGCQNGRSPDSPSCVACGGRALRNGPAGTGLRSGLGCPAHVGNPVCSHDLRSLSGGGNALTRRRGHSYSPAHFQNRPSSALQRRSFTRVFPARPRHRCALATSSSRSVAPRFCAPAIRCGVVAGDMPAHGRCDDDGHTVGRGAASRCRAAAQGDRHRRCARLAACPWAGRGHSRGGKDRGAVGRST